MIRWPHYPRMHRISDSSPLSASSFTKIWERYWPDSTDQYRHWQYQKTLKLFGITQCMLRKGNCLNGAVAENSFGHFKTEIDQYIHWFNHERIQLKLKGLSPVDYRTQSLASVAPPLI
tara:strand:- start:40 stop:393 length:354 start_codon:yes stop_codon:yes gene_type:complete